MTKDIGFIKILFKEMTQWVSKGVISDKHEAAIRELYQKALDQDAAANEVFPETKSSAKAADRAPVRQSARKRESINLAKVVISLASFCLATGVVIFYAANWRKMPPVLKLAQILFLIVATYTSSYFFLRDTATRSPMLGRALLLLGMFSYGAGILLVAQVYHISAHPTNGLLAWGAGVFLMSVLVKERYGLILSLAVFFVWDVWEYGYYGNSAFFFGVPVLLAMAFSYLKVKSKPLFIASLSMFAWYFLHSSLYISKQYISTNTGCVPYILFSIAAVALIYIVKKRNSENDFIKSSIPVLIIIEAIAWLMPLTLFSSVSNVSPYLALLWGSAALVVFFLIKYIPGCYFSLALLFAWNMWDMGRQYNPVYLFALPIVLSAILFFLRKDRLGLVFSGIMFIWYILQVNIYWITKYADTDNRVLLFILAFCMYGALFKSAASVYRNKKEYSALTVFLRIAGRLVHVLPLIILLYYKPSASHAMLVWAGATLITAVMLKEYEGYFAGIGLFAVWQIWDISAGGNNYYFFIIPIVLLFLILYKRKEDIPVWLFSVLGLYYVLSLPLISSYRQFSDFKTGMLSLLVLCLPLASLLLSAGRLMRSKERLASSGTFYSISGWVFFSLFFVSLSWPFKAKSIPFLLMIQNNPVISIEYISLILLSLLCVYQLRIRRDNVHFALPVLLFAALCFFLPLSATSVRMISLHAAIILFSGLFLYYSHCDKKDDRIERYFTFTFIISMLSIKGLVFITYSQIYSEYKLAYLVGFILFAVVCFLVNRFVGGIMKERAIEYSSGVIDAVCAGLVWGCVYLSSFELSEQRSIFEADTTVILLVILFAASALYLYSRIIPRFKNDLPIIIVSLVVFFTSGLVIVIAGPFVSWAFYALVFNALLIIISCSYIYYSTIVESKVLLNLSIGGFILHIVTRYFDVFWDMFSGSLLFIVTGLIGLIGGYFLERNRRKFSRKIDHVK
jgi:uncharacterized membrane protein